MNKTKLISVLITLTPEEWSSFRKYLLMYTRKGSDNFDFFEFLNHKKERLTALPAAEEVRTKHFPKLSAKGFSNMMSRILNWLEDWMAIDEFKQVQYQEDLMLIKSYNRRGLFKLANAKAAKLEKSILNAEGLDIYENKALAELFHIQLYSENAIKYSDGGLMFEKLSDHFFKQVKEYSLLYLPELMNIQRIQKYDLSNAIQKINQVAKLLPESELGTYLEQLIKLNVNNDAQLLEDLFGQVKEGVFSKDGFIHTLMVYYFIAFSLQFWLKGTLQSKALVGEIHDYAIGSGVLLQNKKITLRRFHNIVSTLAAINTYDWTIDFVDRYVDMVDTPNKESSRLLAYAQICMYNNKYDEISKYLSSVTFDDFDIKMRSHCLLAIALYKDEKIELETLQNKILNFKRFLTRHKSRVSEKYYDSNFNFFEVIARLSMKKFQDTVIDLSKYSNLSYRYWIKEELSSFER